MIKKIIYLILLITLSLTMINKVRADEIIINSENDRILYGDTKSVKFIVDNNADSVIFDVVKKTGNDNSQAQILKSYEVLKDDNDEYIININSLELDFGELSIENVKFNINGNIVDSFITKKFLIWDGDLEPPKLYEIVNFFLQTGNTASISFYAEDNVMDVIKFYIDVESDTGDIEKFEGTTAYYNRSFSFQVDYGYWVIRKVKLCDDNFVNNCQTYVFDDDRYSFIMVDERKKFNVDDVNIEVTNNAPFIRNDESINMIFNIENDNNFKYVAACINPLPTYNKIDDCHVMSKKDDNYNLSFIPDYYNNYTTALYEIFSVIIVDKYGRYGEKIMRPYEITETNQANVFFRIANETEQFLPILKNIEVEEKKAFRYGNSYIHLLFTIDEYVSGKIKKAKFKFDNIKEETVVSSEFSCNLKYETDDKYSCNIDVYFPLDGIWKISRVYLIDDNDTNIYYPYLFDSIQYYNSVPDSIYITKMPNKMDYYVGEYIDLTGLEVIGEYNDGEKIDVTQYIITDNYDNRITKINQTIDIYLDCKIGTINFTSDYPKITFINDNKEVISSKEYEYGTKAIDIIKPSNPSKENTAEYTYIFAGWEPVIEDVTQDATYKAIYNKTKNKYTVTWENYDGTILEIDENVEYGTMASYDANNPIKEKDVEYIYLFDKWDKDISTVTGNVTYTATYKSNKRIYIDSITTNKYTLTLNTDKTYTLIATINPNNTTEDKTLTWISSNPEVVIVDDYGKVKALSEGNAIITVSTENNKTATIEVIVDNSLESESILGDMDNDGIITLKDVILILRKYLGIEEGQNDNDGDIDGDGSLELKDVILLLRMFLGM